MNAVDVVTTAWGLLRPELDDHLGRAGRETAPARPGLPTQTAAVNTLDWLGVMLDLQQWISSCEGEVVQELEELGWVSMRLDAELWELQRLAHEVREATHALGDLSRDLSLAFGVPHRAFAGYAGLAHTLAAMRTTAGLTQDELGGRLGFSKAMVSHLESYRRARRPAIDVVAAWAEACGHDFALWFAPNNGDGRWGLVGYLIYVIQTGLNNREIELLVDAAVGLPVASSRMRSAFAALVRAMGDDDHRSTVSPL